jgi:hypothetical protein
VGQVQAEGVHQVGGDSWCRGPGARPASHGRSARGRPAVAAGRPRSPTAPRCAHAGLRAAEPRTDRRLPCRQRDWPSLTDTVSVTASPPAHRRSR